MVIVVVVVVVVIIAIVAVECVILEGFCSALHRELHNLMGIL
jgi:hypothetical protein